MQQVGLDRMHQVSTHGLHIWQLYLTATLKVGQLPGDEAFGMLQGLFCRIDVSDVPVTC